MYISSFVSVLKLSKASLTARKQTFGPRVVFSIKWRLSSHHFILQTCWRLPQRYVKDCTMHEHLSPIASRDRKQWQRWRPGRQKWQPEVDIFPLSVLWLGTFVQREFKQRHSDSLCETEAFHQARHCYSWRPGHQRSRYLSLLLGSLNNNDGDGYENITQKVN